MLMNCGLSKNLLNILESNFSFASFVKQLEGHHKQSIRGTQDRFKRHKFLKGY